MYGEQLSPEAPRPERFSEVLEVTVPGRAGVLPKGSMRALVTAGWREPEYGSLWSISKRLVI